MKYIPSSLQKIRDVEAGEDVIIQDFVDLYKCRIGDGSKIATFVEIQENVKIGERCKICSHVLISQGVTIEDEVFVGHGVIFVNYSYLQGQTKSSGAQTVQPITPAIIKRGASIGSGAVIMGNVVVGKKALVGAGTVVTEDVPDGATVVGNPARILDSKVVGT